MGSEHRLLRVDRWDSGVYYCTTNTTRKHITVRVEESPPKIAKDENEFARVDGVAGGEATLSCRVEAIPVPRVRWYQTHTSAAGAGPTEGTPLATGAVEFSKKRLVSEERTL